MSRRSAVREAGPSVRVKEERVKVKEEKNKGKQRAHIEESEEEQQEQDPDAEGEDEDAQGEEDNGDEEGEAGSPRGSKRMRVNGDGDSAPSGSQPQIPRVKTLPRGNDGYIPGSIVRIQLQNFVTYDYVQFFPGPYLNMIIGPNGTGKSSIACAIALGLNFPPAILGRATELNSFVKNGTESGYIEIELKGPKGRGNLVIRRNLSAASKSSSFTLNGSSATGNEIKNKMMELNVQVGNLCSFLPQDRVSEFAGMSPQQLLRETQRAAGDENLTKWHNILIDAGKDLRQLQQTIKVEEDSLKQMKDRNEGIERDVQRFLERQKIEQMIALLELLIPVAEYREIRQKFLEARAAQRKLHAKVKSLKDRNAPAHDLLRKYESDFKSADKSRDALKKTTQAKFKQLAGKNKASDDLDTESQNIVDKLATLKQEEKDRLKQMKSLENEISRLEAEIVKPPPADLATEDELREDMRKLNADRSKISSRIEDLNQMMTNCVNKGVGFKERLKAAEKELKKQDDVDVQKLNAMARWDKDTHDAILWVRANRHLFKHEVFETPFMRLTVKDRRFTNQIEACFGGNQMKTFVAQCQEDCDVLNKHINDEGALGRKVRVTTWFRSHQEDLLVPPPMSPEEMNNLHFDGYAIDYVDYPEGMKWFLMRDVNLHRAAIALNSNINVNEAMALVARPTRNHPGGATFINGNTMNIVNRSRYGKKAVGNMTRDVPQARNLSPSTINPEVKQQLDATIREAQEGMSLCEEERLQIKQKLAETEPLERAFHARQEEIKKKRDAIKNEEKRLYTAKSRLTSKKQSLITLRKRPSADEERAKLKKKLISNTQKRMQYAKDYTVLVQCIIHDQQECTTVGLKYLQIGANKIALEELCSRKDEKYQTALKDYQKADDLFRAVKERSKEVLTRSRDVLSGAPEEVRQEFNKIEEVRLQWENDEKEAKKRGLPPPSKTGVDFRTAEDLQAELDTQRANLDMNLNTNPGVVEQYEKRKRDIEQLERALAEKKRREARIEKDIKSARDNWHPALQKLVSSIGEKFSAAFDRIGCAGEIRINENEDYEKWAIDILVKFRDSEKLQLLTAHRQSGGERSLTTILYLMSLTEEARAPFSLVDEINQGMDQRAERVVHNSMVNVTCQPDSAQYFLITPKLLPDLEYHERMRILCVNNGEWLPEERNLSGRMKDMIDAFVAEQRRRGAGEM